MSFLINPYIFAETGIANAYSVNFPTYTTTPANIEYIKINNQSNAIDTALRDTTPNVSISGWYKCDSGSNAQIRELFSKYDNYAGVDRCMTIRLETSNKLLIYTQYDAVTSSVILVTTRAFTTADGWFHWCFVYDYSQTTAGTIAKLYINGVEITAYDTQTVSTTNKYFFNQATQSNRAFIGTIEFAGGAARTPSRGAGGFVDEMTFWDKSLSAAEVTELYNSGEAYNVSLMSSYSTNCLAWWRMGDYVSDNWDGTKWNFVNVKGTANTNFESVNLVEADRVTDAP